MSTYNIRSTDQDGIYTITKFDDDLNIESYYTFKNTTNGFICECPAGQRPSCRHRQMFPELVTRVDSAWMLDFDTRSWVDPTGEAKEAAIEEATCGDPKVEHGAVTGRMTSSTPNFEESTPTTEPIVRQPDHHPFRRRL